MEVYDDRTPKFMSYISAPNSTAHTYGNLTAFVTEKIKSWFHPEYFKTVNISSTIASHYFNILRNQKRDFFKKEKPYLIIVPRVEDNEGTFMSDTLMTNRFSEEVPGYDSGNLFTLIEDKPKGLSVKYMINRDKISFDVTIMVETMIQQIDIYKMMKNRILFNKPLTWNTNLECQIPRQVMAGVSFLSGIPLTQPAELIDYCNSNSDSPITYMLKNSSGNDEYFKYYNSNLDVVLSRPQLSDSSKKELVDDYYAITFTTEVEFYTVGEYFVYTTPEKRYLVETDMRGFMVKDPYENDPSKMSLEIIFTPFEEVGIPHGDGWTPYAESPFRVEAKRPDIISFEPLLNSTMLKLIDYHKKMNIPMDRFIKFYIMKDGKLLDFNEGHYVIDIDDLCVYMYNISKLSTYRLIIMTDKKYINELNLELIQGKQ